MADSSHGGRLFRALLRLLPFDFRSDYGHEIEQVFSTQVTTIAAGAGIVAGLAPAVYALRSDPARLVRSGSRYSSSGLGRLSSLLVVGQVATSLALLVSGGLFVRSLKEARHVDLGSIPETCS